LTILDPDHDTEASPRRRAPAFSFVHARFASEFAARASKPLGMDEKAARLEEGSEREGKRMDLNAVNAAEAVTLVVYGWTAAEPGTLWWAFPSVAAALAAARAMRNAVRWAIVQGPPRGAIVDIAKARAAGSVLIEQTHAAV
jgi:hypothetical protein